MTNRERLERAEAELRDALASTLDRRIPALVTALVTAALVAGVEAERTRNASAVFVEAIESRDSQKSDTPSQISVVKNSNDQAN